MKYCTYHKLRGHNTKECKQLHEALMMVFVNGHANPDPLRQNPLKITRAGAKARKGSIRSPIIGCMTSVNKKTKLILLGIAIAQPKRTRGCKSIGIST